MIMTSQNATALPPEICAKVKHLGYTTSALIRLYGEEFEVLSEPFPEAGGIAVRVKARKDRRICVLQLPSTVLQVVHGESITSR
jgi:hypothetical protein